MENKKFSMKQIIKWTRTKKYQLIFALSMTFVIIDFLILISYIHNPYNIGDFFNDFFIMYYFTEFRTIVFILFWVSLLICILSFILSYINKKINNKKIRMREFLKNIVNSKKPLFIFTIISLILSLAFIYIFIFAASFVEVILLGLLFIVLFFIFLAILIREGVKLANLVNSNSFNIHNILCLNTYSKTVLFVKKKAEFKSIDILSIRMEINYNTVYKSGIAEALVGGVLFGGTGAIAGGMVGNKEKTSRNAIIYIETTDIVNAGITIKTSPEKGFEICKALEAFKKKYDEVDSSNEKAVSENESGA